MMADDQPALGSAVKHEVEAGWHPHFLSVFGVAEGIKPAIRSAIGEGVDLLGLDCRLQVRILGQLVEIGRDLGRRFERLRIEGGKKDRIRRIKRSDWSFALAAAERFDPALQRGVNIRLGATSRRLGDNPDEADDQADHRDKRFDANSCWSSLMISPPARPLRSSTRLCFMLDLASSAPLKNFPLLKRASGRRFFPIAGYPSSRRRRELSTA